MAGHQLILLDHRQTMLIHANAVVTYDRYNLPGRFTYGNVYAAAFCRRSNAMPHRIFDNRLECKRRNLRRDPFITIQLVAKPAAISDTLNIQICLNQFKLL